MKKMLKFLSISLLISSFSVTTGCAIGGGRSRRGSSEEESSEVRSGEDHGSSTSSSKGSSDSSSSSSRTSSESSESSSEEARTYYNVTFKQNYQGAGDDRVSRVKPGNTVKEWTPTIRIGYRCTGWYLEPECTNQYDFSLPVNDDLTLYAQWMRRGSQLKVTFNFNYTGAPRNVEVTGETGTPLATKDIPDPQRLGYQVSGWYLDKNCTKPFDTSSNLEDDTTLFAKYKKTSNLEFDANTGMVKLSNVEVPINFRFLTWNSGNGQDTSLNELVNSFNSLYSGKVHISWTGYNTNEIGRFEPTGQVTNYIDHQYRFGEMLDLLGMPLNRNSYYEGGVDENYVGDYLLSYPVGYHLPCIIYNKSMASTLGLSPNENWTHADFKNALELATSTYKNSISNFYALAHEGEWPWLEMTSDCVWSNSGIRFYDYNSSTQKYVNSFDNNKEAARDAVKGYVDIFNNPKISIYGNVRFPTDEFPNFNEKFKDIASGKGFMALVGHPIMISKYLYPADNNFFNKVGILPLTNFFNYGNRTNSQIFGKGACFYYPKETNKNCNLQKMAGFALFCDYVAEHSDILVKDNLVPASKSCINSSTFASDSSVGGRICRASIGSYKGRIQTLPGHGNNYPLFNYHNESFVSLCDEVDGVTDTAMIDVVVQGVIDDINAAFAGEM